MSCIRLLYNEFIVLYHQKIILNLYSRVKELHFIMYNIGQKRKFLILQ